MLEYNLYYYRGLVKSVYDGDTITVSLDLGMNISRDKIKLRLFGINAPELRGSTLIEARGSRDFLRGLILNKEVLIQTIKDKKGKYGRYLANVWIIEDKAWININDKMVSEGYAVSKDY